MAPLLRRPTSAALRFPFQYARLTHKVPLRFWPGRAGQFAFEDADAPLAPDAPFLSFAEPALLLVLSTLGTLGAQIGNRDLCDSPLLRSRFVGGGEKAGVAGR